MNNDIIPKQVFQSPPRLADGDWFLFLDHLYDNYLNELVKLSSSDRDQIISDSRALFAVAQTYSRQYELSKDALPRMMVARTLGARRHVDSVYFRVRSVLKLLILKLKHPSEIRIFSKKIIYFYGAFDILTLDDLRAQRDLGRAIRFKYVDENLTKNPNVSHASCPTAIREFWIAVIDRTNSNQRSLAIEGKVKQGLVDYLAESWCANQVKVGQIELAIKSRKVQPELVIFTNIAKPEHKILAIIYRRLNIETVAYPHGNYISPLTYRSFGFVEPFPYKTFRVPGGWAKNHFETKFQASGLQKFWTPNFSASSGVSQVRLPQRREAGANCVYDVALVGFNFNLYRYADEIGCYGPLQALLENKILDVLESTALSVVYKGHPDRKLQVKEIHGDKKFKIDFCPFESAATDAKTIIFTRIETSCFLPALLSRRNIVLLYPRSNMCNPDFWEYVKRRCAIVTTDFSDDNSLDFDVNDLINALHRQNDEMLNEGVHLMKFFH